MTDDRADLGDAERRRTLRLRQGPPGHPPGARSCGCPPSSTSRGRRSCTCRRRCRTRDPRIRRLAPAGRWSRSSGGHDGRAFVLFTSYDNLRAGAPASPRRASPIRCWCRARRPDRRCSGEFKSTPNAVLFATSSFWQGVDVVGEALSCVIIDKLPFASPGDPITSRASRPSTPTGGNAFGEYQIPLAILALQQGLGRLIRHRQDRGVLAILDPRLRTMGYGRRFLASLPPAPVTHDLAALDKFFDA